MEKKAWPFEVLRCNETNANKLRRLRFFFQSDKASFWSQLSHEPLPCHVILFQSGLFEATNLTEEANVEERYTEQEQCPAEYNVPTIFQNAEEEGGELKKTAAKTMKAPRKMPAGPHWHSQCICHSGMKGPATLMPRNSNHASVNSVRYAASSGRSKWAIFSSGFFWKQVHNILIRLCWKQVQFFL